ncbi:MAG: nuclear transport factor 2 family protein [Ginsengibacter sp.]
MKKVLFCAIACSVFVACSNPQPADEKSATPAIAETKSLPTEIADAKYTDIGKRGLAALSAGDIDTWMNDYADNARYYWNSGDSLIGKAAISAYWKNRRTTVIDSLTYMSDIWLPVKVNEPQQKVHTKGVWLLGWFMVRAKYKTGKSMGQWMHVDYHFNADDKIDQAIQYMDRVPINAAMAK